MGKADKFEHPIEMIIDAVRFYGLRADSKEDYNNFLILLRDRIRLMEK